jgi:integrase
MTLPVTEEIIELLNQCEPTDPAPFVRQLWYRDRHHGPKPAPRGNNMDALWKQFRDLKESVGITRSIRPHDLRRTAAVKIYELTGDLRAAQALLGHVDLASTLHYLDHHLTPVRRSDLELIKKQERKSA